jgi:hypothetical protein
MKSLVETFLASAISRVGYYKELAEKSFAQLEEEDFHFKPNGASNSIAVIIQHMAGNMLSRWTNFLSEDGEKEWRNRDEEFEEKDISSVALLIYWQKGWDCFLNTLHQLTEEDLLKIIHIRAEPTTVIDAINRQMAHYPYHVGQIVYLARFIKDTQWESLSIPPGMSSQFNHQMGHLPDQI